MVCDLSLIKKAILGCVLGLAPFAGLLYGNSADTSFTVGGLITHYRMDCPIYIALYSNDIELKSMKGQTHLRLMPDSLPADSMHYTFTNVKPGFYVVAAYQDIDKNRKLNMGFFGPTEPYYIYRHNYGIFGPKFDACKFPVNRDVHDADLRF